MIFIYIVEYRGREVSLWQALFSSRCTNSIHTVFLPDIVCFECCSHHARIICFFAKRKVWNFFDGLSYFFFYVYVEYKRYFHRRSIAITNIYYIYIIARTNKNNYVLLMIVHNPMDPLINDPSLLHD